MEAGLRVVRGPDWMWGNQDGGEGNVGTIIHLGQDGGSLPDGTVLVYWDSGKQMNYRVGHSGKFDLRILDSAPTGIKHVAVVCDGCGEGPIVGTRWNCIDCPNYDLCTQCFMADVHDRSHSFLRIDKSRGEGVPVGKRADCTRIKSKGFFPGAKVTRGKDWQWADQDGGNIGTLTAITPWNDTPRSGANVAWNILRKNNYRTGYLGKYIGKVGKIVKIDADGDVHVNYGLQSWVFHPDAVKKVSTFASGNKVRVLRDRQLVQNLQQGHGGWNDSMAGALGKEGVILEVDSDGDVVVLVGANLWLFNPEALEDLTDGEAPVRRNDTPAGATGNDSSSLLHMLFLDAMLKGAAGDAGDRLVNASSIGNFQNVREILEAHPDKIDHKRNGKTALHVACHQGRPEIVKYLLGKGADQGIKDEQDYTALHHAAYGDRTGETVRIMIDTGVNVNVCDNQNKSTPLHLAVNQDNEAGVKALLSSSNCNVNCQDKEGDTPLHDAIAKDKNTIVDLILQSSRLDITITNIRGFNPLHLACLKGNKYAVQKIIDKYPGLIDFPKEDGFTALHLAAFNNHIEIARCLLLSHFLNSCVSVGLGNKYAVQKIIDKYPGLIDFPKEDGFTALHLAAFNNHIEIARCLLLSGHCGIDLPNHRGQTALALAVTQAYVKMIELLVEHGANVNAQDNDGDTPLHLAVILHAMDGTGLAGLFQTLMLNLPSGGERDENTASAIALYLVLHGAEVDFFNHQGKTPLDLCRNPVTVNLLRQNARSRPR
ncbi:PREDICTED: E3 ubiquitin-protein ligase MIB1-like [Acropora digitifera]|uniref:E3 ubiquitin-protein ligase MIB1-like n=1 Tax=Acropora digitifera TaxID=70779 RepID=UPI00077A7E8D|nr:PREDICTED: E3 ubiquitin-protein ligase MIB1-like [Acropora digitifera]